MSHLIQTETEETLWLNVDSMLQETRAHGNNEFPFKCYETFMDWSKRGFVECHWHKELEFILIRSKSVIGRVSDQTLNLKQGDCILVNSGVVHWLEAPEDNLQREGHWISVLFSPEFIAPIYSVIYKNIVNSILESGVNFFDLRKNEEWKIRVCDLLERIVSLSSRESITQELDIHVALCEIWKEIFSHLSEQSEFENRSRNLLLQSRLRVMLRFIWDNFTKQVKLDDIAKSANISMSEAQRCFRSCIHDSPYHYLQMYRLNYAKRQLLLKNCSILDAAFNSGFQNISHFNHMFKREFGITPKQFIRSFN